MRFYKKNVSKTYDVLEQESPGSEWYRLLCSHVSKEFAEWSVKPENCPEGLERYYEEYES